MRSALLTTKGTATKIELMVTRASITAFNALALSSISVMYLAVP